MATCTNHEINTGFSTTSYMWRKLSSLLEGEYFPSTLNEAIYCLCDGKAKVVPKKEKSLIAGLGTSTEKWMLITEVDGFSDANDPAIIEAVYALCNGRAKLEACEQCVSTTTACSLG